MKLVVGTYASVNAYANDQGWKPNVDYKVVTSVEELRQAAGTPVDKIYITYGWRIMPSSKALAIADFLDMSGISRKDWIYV